MAYLWNAPIFVMYSMFLLGMAGQHLSMPPHSTRSLVSSPDCGLSSLSSLGSLISRKHTSVRTGCHWGRECVCPWCPATDFHPIHPIVSHFTPIAPGIGSRSTTIPYIHPEAPQDLSCSLAAGGPTMLGPLPIYQLPRSPSLTLAFFLSSPFSPF